MQTKSLPVNIFRKTVQSYLKTCESNSFWQKQTAQYVQLSPEEKSHKHGQLLKILQNHDKYTLFRGTMGNMELQHAVETGRLGQDFGRGGKSLSFDLPAYIRENDSAYFLSASTCPITAKPYASGCFTPLPRRGFIVVLGMPKVFTTPNKVLRANKKLFTDYDDNKLAHDFNFQNSDGTLYTPITDMTRRNNETTLILTNYSARKNWRPKMSTDIKQIIEVCGPGKFLGSMMSFSQPILLTELTNPTFQKRQWSMEVFLDCTSEDVLETAVQEQLLQPGNRFLSLHDIDVIDDFGILDNLAGEGEDTLVLDQVPASIPEADQDQLLAYMNDYLQEHKKTPSMPPKF